MLEITAHSLEVAFPLMMNFVFTPLRTYGNSPISAKHVGIPGVCPYATAAKTSLHCWQTKLVYPLTPFTLHTTGLSVSSPALQLGGFSRLSSSDHSCYGSTAPVKLDPAVAGHSTDLSVSLVWTTPLPPNGLLKHTWAVQEKLLARWFPLPQTTVSSKEEITATKSLGSIFRVRP